MEPTRRPGRPSLDAAAKSVPVSLKLPPRQYDEVYQQAQRERISIPEVIRRSLNAARKFGNPK